MKTIKLFVAAAIMTVAVSCGSKENAAETTPAAEETTTAPAEETAPATTDTTAVAAPADSTAAAH